MNGFMELFLNIFLQYNTNQLNWGNDDCKGEELGRGQYYQVVKVTKGRIVTHQVSPEVMHQEVCNIISVEFLPKMHDLRQDMKNHQVDPG